MLHLPEHALKKIIATINADPQVKRVHYTQDDKSIEQLKEKNIDYETVDVGFGCHRCNLVCKLIDYLSRKEKFDFVYLEGRCMKRVDLMHYFVGKFLRLDCRWASSPTMISIIYLAFYLKLNKSLIDV